MNDFLPVLARLTAARKPHFWVKETLIGLLVGLGLGIGAQFSVEWMLWLVAGYCISVQAVGMTDNEVFASFADFRRLGFRHPSGFYRLAYLTHYLARDMFVANGVSAVLGGVVMIVTGKAWAVVLLLALLLGNLALLPSRVHLADRMSERARTVYIGVLYVALVALAGPLALGWSFPPRWAIPVGAAWLIVTVLLSFLLDAVAARLTGAGSSSLGARRFFSWLKPLSPHLFKDAVLFHPMALASLAMGFTLFTVLAVGSPVTTVPALLMLALGHDNYLLARRKGSHRIVAEDPLFGEAKLPASAAQLRRSKLLSIATDIPVKMLIFGIILTAYGALRVDHLAAMLAVCVTVFVVQAPLPYSTGRLPLVLRYLATYAPLVMFLVVTQFNQPMALVWLLCGVTIATYLPTLISTFRIRPTASDVQQQPGPEPSPLTHDLPRTLFTVPQTSRP